VVQQGVAQVDAGDAFLVLFGAVLVCIRHVFLLFWFFSSCVIEAFAFLFLLLLQSLCYLHCL